MVFIKSIAKIYLHTQTRFLFFFLKNSKIMFAKLLGFSSYLALTSIGHLDFHEKPFSQYAIRVVLVAIV